MWQHFKANQNEAIDIDMKLSFYCGDAAGRPARNGVKKDFSDADMRFAAKIGMKFHTPESFFLGQAMTGV